MISAVKFTKSKILEFGCMRPLTKSKIWNRASTEKPEEFFNEKKSICERRIWYERIAQLMLVQPRRRDGEERSVLKYVSTAGHRRQHRMGGQQQAKGQVKKGIRRMPWHWEPKKDVTSCEKLR